MKKLFYLLVSVLALFSCSDKIDLSKKLDSGKTALVVDAFIDNLPQKQKVVLTSTQYYFDNSGPKMATGATVTLTDLTTQEAFPLSEANQGEYFSELDGDAFIKTGHDYQLNVSYQNQNYVAYSNVNRVVPIDSITFEMTKNFAGDELPGYFDAQFWADDVQGPGDRYWIRSYRNDTRFTDADHIGIAYDASSFSTGITDGVTFILPLRQFFINEQDTAKKWKPEQKITVEICSITKDAAFFLAQVVTQSSLGSGTGVGGALGALFATPPSNVPTNIKNTDVNGSKAAGFFCTSAVYRAETIVPIKAYRKP